MLKHGLKVNDFLVEDISALTFSQIQLLQSITLANLEAKWNIIAAATCLSQQRGAGRFDTQVFDHGFGFFIQPSAAAKDHPRANEWQMV